MKFQKKIITLTNDLNFSLKKLSELLMDNLNNDDKLKVQKMISKCCNYISLIASISTLSKEEILAEKESTLNIIEFIQQFNLVIKNL